MRCEVEFTDVFYTWWMTLTENQQDRIAAAVGLLEDHGTELGFPRSSAIRGSRYKQMRELRVQIDGDPYRILYAFDARRVALLLIGGHKRGDDQWYAKAVPRAEKLLKEHLKEMDRNEGEE